MACHLVAVGLELWRTPAYRMAQHFRFLVSCTYVDLYCTGAKGVPLIRARQSGGGLEGDHSLTCLNGA